MYNYIISGFSDEIDPSLNEQIEVVKKLGIDHIEIRGVNGKNITEHTLEEVEQIKKILDKHSIKVSAVGSPIGKIFIEEDFQSHFEIYKHTVNIAKILNTKYIRMFSFFIKDGNNPNDYKEEVFRRLKLFIDYAKEKNIILLHENEKGIYGDIAKRCVTIMEELYCDNFKLIFDFANFVQCKQDTIEAYEMLKKYIHYLHIKDAVFETGEVTPSGYGDGKVKEILSDLFKSGYEGVLSLEPHLADFTGFKKLEIGTTQEKNKLTGEESFTLAFNSLNKILESL